MQAEELKKLLDYHDDLYYNQDEPEISDIEYDALKARYLMLTGEDEYAYVPGDAKFSKVKHSEPILSLDKVKITDEAKLRSELLRLFGKTGGVIEPKFDGLTIVKYQDGRCVTRGNGEVGEDVTENCEKIPELVNMDTENYAIRTEVLMKKSVFEAINKEREKEGLPLFKNPRNAAAGMIRNKDASKVRGLTAYAYDALGWELNQTSMLNCMSDMNVTPYWFFKDVDEAIRFIKEFDRDSLDYEIDGLVIKSNRTHALAHFGITGHHPKHAIAVKFVAEEVWAELKEIKWQVGRTGKVVPVAEFETVNLMGSDVSRATLHNIAYIEALGMKEIDRLKHKNYVKITKANDIIPAVVDFKEEIKKGASPYVFYEKIEALEACPDCGSVLDKVKDQIFCRNENCKERMIGQAIHLASKEALDIAGLSEETVRKMYDALEVVENFTFPLLFHEKESLLYLEGFADKSATKLAKTINEKTDKTTLSRFLIACGIPLVGKTASKTIAKKFKSLDDLASDLIAGKTILKSIEGIGTEIISSLETNWDRIITLKECILEIESEYEEPKAKRTDQKTIVVTGSFEKPRSYFTNLIESYGHKSSSSISKKTSFVLVGEEAGPKKLEKIEELNIPVITTEEELMKLLM